VRQSLWAFSLGFYGLPGVASACLRCQDEAGADVSLLLLLLWRAADGVSFDTAAIADLDSGVADWRENVVQPLRGVRRFLKSETSAASGVLRERIKAAELESERQELEALARRVAHVGQALTQPGEQAARHNLAAYAAATGHALPGAAVEELVTALAAMAVQADAR
jgi:uncharacterized protein (TIGR02444 family)